MENTTDSSPLTTVQQCVVNALAAGSTLTDAAEAYGVHRVTIYRWMKNCQPFSAALRRARAEFVLARRDDLYLLSNRALDALLAILDNPKTPPAVLLRTAMFILQRPQLPKTGWSMPEPAPDPDAETLLDSAVVEQAYASEDDPTPAPSEALDDTDVAPRNPMQHDSGFHDDVTPPAAPSQGLPPCPVPPDVLKSPHQSMEFLEILDEIDGDYKGSAELRDGVGLMDSTTEVTE